MYLLGKMVLLNKHSAQALDTEPSSIFGHYRLLQPCSDIYCFLLIPIPCTLYFDDFFSLNGCGYMQISVKFCCSSALQNTPKVWVQRSEKVMGKEQALWCRGAKGRLGRQSANKALIHSLLIVTLK